MECGTRAQDRKVLFSQQNDTGDPVSVAEQYLDFKFTGVLCDFVEDRLLRRQFSLSDEKELQEQMYLVLSHHVGLAFPTVPVEREVSVRGGIIDFRVGNLGIEVKIAGSKRAIYEQCQGYSMDASILALMLVTNKAMTMPPQINGKAVRVVSLGESWL